MTLTPLGHFPGQPASFNHDVAEAVFGYIAKLDDDSAEVVADMLIGDIYQRDLIANEVVLSKALGDYVDRHGERIRESLTRSYIAKRAGDESVDGVLAAAELVAKAFGGSDYSPQARAERARQQHRDLITGKFAKDHRRIQFDTHDEQGKPLHPAGDARGKRLGIPETPNLKGEDRLRFEQAYGQVRGLVSHFQRDPEGAFLHLHYGDGTEIHDLPSRGSTLPIDHGRKLYGATVSRVDVGSDLSPFETLQDLGGAVAGNYPIGTGDNGNPGVQRIRDIGTAAHTDLGARESNLMMRLGVGSRALDESFQRADGSSTLPRKVQAALKAGQVVGTYGPEAQKVIGPAADKAAYRYRGVERQTPDRRLTNTIQALSRAPGVKSAADRRELMVHGVETDNGWHPSGVLNYFRNRLPSADLNTLQRKSGTIPPSEGVIIDRQGKVTSQAVGYGDDHYLPFNLKHLKGLRGGEYIRTRTWGGPTTEDVYTGLISGAKSMTVVSHNGVYTVEFAPGFTGKRRYNDKAARMVSRYGYLLDAVQSGEITTGRIHPSRMGEINDQAASSFDPDLEPDAYKQERARLLAREARAPEFSAAQRAEVAQKFLDNEALKHKTRDGHELTRDELVDDWVTRQALQRGPSGGASAADVKRQIAGEHGLTEPDPGQFSANAIQAMGLGDKFDRFTAREEQTYRASLRPLQLNGEGYELALNALQEQFPYYVKSVDYHPWRDADNGSDTGYVKPKHNRPAQVLSGYFDRDLGGKVQGHTTRFQHGRREAVAYVSPRERVMDRARATLPGSDGQQRALSPDTARELRMDSDRKMLTALRSHDRYSSSIDGGAAFPKLSDARGDNIVEAEIRAISPDLHELLFKPASELQDLQRTPEGADQLHRKLANALGAVEKHKVFDLDPGALRSFRAEGKPAKASQFDAAQIGQNLRGIGEDSDFGQRVYDKGAQPGETEIQNAWKGNRHIVALAPSPAEYGPEQQAAVVADLERRHKAVVNWQANGSSPMQRPPGAERLGRDVEVASRAAQLRRRHEEAVERNKAPDEQGDGGVVIGMPGGGQLHLGFANGGGSAPSALQAPQSQINGQFKAMTAGW